MSLRKIIALPLGNGDLSVIGKEPEIVWVAPTDLWVDDTYQRKMSERTMQLLRKTVAGFSWNRMKVPVVVRAEEGDLHLIDGQHTAIAAASRGVQRIPVMVVQAVALDERARAFVGHNTDHVVVSPLDIYRALLASGDQVAKDVDSVCKSLGVRIRLINPTSVVAEGDTSAVNTIRSLVRLRGSNFARQVLEVLVKAKCAPILARHIKAVEALLTGPDRIVDTTMMVRVIRTDGPAGVDAAAADGRRRRIAHLAALIERWRGMLKAEAA